VGINLGFNSPQKPQLDQAMWTAVIFKSIQQNQLKKIQSDEKLDFTIDKPESKISSVNLLEYTSPPETPNDFDFEYIVPPSDSGEEKFEGDPEIMMDSTETTSDSTKMMIDSTETIPDSTEAIQDSTQKNLDSLEVSADSIEVDWREIDSLARIEQFHYQREEKTYVELQRKKQSKFFLEPSSTYKTRSVRIDSTGHCFARCSG